MILIKTIEIKTAEQYFRDILFTAQVRSVEVIEYTEFHLTNCWTFISYKNRYQTQYIYCLYLDHWQLLLFIRRIWAIIKVLEQTKYIQWRVII